MAEEKMTTQDILNINGALNGTQNLQGLLYIKGIGVGKMALVKIAKAIRPLVEAYSEAVQDIQEKYSPDDKGIVKDQKEMVKEMEELAKQEEATVLPKIKLSFLEKLPDVVAKHLEWLQAVLEE